MRSLSLLAIVATFTILSCAVGYAGTVTKSYQTPCPGGTYATHTLVYDADDARLLSSTQVLCSGASRTTTYQYRNGLITLYTPSGGTISMSGSNFDVSVASTMEIVSVTSGSVVYTYPSTIAANSTTAIWGSLGSGLFLLVARNPSGYSAVYATTIFFN